MDEGEWVDAGLYDPSAPQAADRLGLLRYLDELGCSLEEMVDADAAGRLFALSGDRQVRPPGPRYTAEQAAEVVGLPVELLIRAWRALGLPTPTGALLSDLDLDALRMVAGYRELLGDDAVLGMSRVVGASIARIAEAGSSALRTGMSEIALGVSGSEEATARAYARVTALVPGVGRLMDAVYRHHVDSARRHFEAVQGDAPGLTVRCGVGFADLSGFTTLSRQVELGELSRLLAAFEAIASDTVHAGGGRVVKFLGDAVMFVAPEALRLAAIARDLVQHPSAAKAGLPVRAGLAHGDLLAQEGDYFGPPVNLAARLTDVARPGQLLVDEAVAKALGLELAVGDCEPRVLRGFDAPVPTWEVRLS